MTPFLRHLLIILLLSVSAHSAHAGKRVRQSELPQPYINKPVQAGDTVWYCAYNSRKLTIDCQLGAKADAPVAAQTMDFGARMPLLARRILTTPDQLAGETIHIPLHAPPFELALVGQLAEGVMCGARAGCGIIFGNDSVHLAELVADFEMTRKEYLATCADQGCAMRLPRMS